MSYLNDLGCMRSLEQRRCTGSLFLAYKSLNKSAPSYISGLSNQKLLSTKLGFHMICNGLRHGRNVRES